MPTLPDHPGVSRIQTESPALPYESTNLPDKQIKAPNMHLSDIFWSILGIFWEKYWMFDEFLRFNIGISSHSTAPTVVEQPIGAWSLKLTRNEAWD